jgi:hypothetical protein
MERKKLFSGAFLKTLEPDNIIMDFRQINEMDDSELSHVKYIFNHIPGQRTSHCLCKHYGSIVSEFEKKERINFLYPWETLRPL